MKTLFVLGLLIMFCGAGVAFGGAFAWLLAPSLFNIGLCFAGLFVMVIGGYTLQAATL